MHPGSKKLHFSWPGHRQATLNLMALLGIGATETIIARHMIFKLDGDKTIIFERQLS